MKLDINMLKDENFKKFIIQLQEYSKEGIIAIPLQRVNSVNESGVMLAPVTTQTSMESTEPSIIIKDAALYSGYVNLKYAIKLPLYELISIGNAVGSYDVSDRDMNLIDLSTLSSQLSSIDAYICLPTDVRLLSVYAITNKYGFDNINNDELLSEE